MRALGRDGKVMFAVNLAFSLGMGLYAFVMPAYARQLGATPANWGALLSGMFALGTLATIPGGAWADRYCRRRLMLIGWAMCLPVPIIFALAPTWIWLLPGYIPFFLSFFCNPAINAYVAGLADHSKMGTVWGTINSAFPLGFIIGPSLGSLVIRAWGMKAAFAGAFCFFLLSFLLLFQLTPECKRPRPVAVGGETPPGPGAAKPVPGPACGRSVLEVAALFAAFHLILAVGQNYIALYLQDSAGLDLGAVSAFGSAGALGGFLMAPLIGRLRDRRGTALALPVSLGLVAAAYGGLLATKAPVLLFGLLTMRGGENGVFSLGQAEVSTRAPADSMGRTFAMFNVMTGIAGTAGPYLGGVLYVLNRRLPFVAVVLGCAALALASRLVLGRPSWSAAPRAQALDAGPG